MLKRLFAWVGRNERWLSTVAFLVSFVIDNIFYTNVALPWITILFTGMFLIAAGSIIGSHYLHRTQADAVPSYHRPFYTLLPIIAAFFTGGMLSGCLIFYTRSANIFTSWPFILILAAIFFGNELFSRYRERLTFQSAQLFFALYLSMIFEIPVLTGEMSKRIFIESGLAALGVFAVFVVLLWLVAKKRFIQSWRRILITIAAIVVIVNLSYFTGIIPPLPLTLKDADIYHSVVRTDTGYEAEAEAATTTGLFATEVIHHVPGTPLFAYSAVYAPTKLSTPIEHTWEQYNDATKSWQVIATIPFYISGGRDTGYRGYSELTYITPGAWLVLIETTDGSVLGRIRFDVEDVASEPALIPETK